MNLDLLSGLIGGQGNGSPIAMLLPMLLGGKGVDFGSIFGKKGGNTGQSGVGNDGFPPLFGRNAETNGQDINGLFRLLGNMNGNISLKKEDSLPKKEFPYELQYNRPYRE